MKKFAIIFLLLTACDWFSPRDATEPDPDEAPDLLTAARIAQNERLAATAGIMAAHPSGWIAPNSCDGALWSYKTAAATCPGSFNPQASEFEPGRYGRRPPPPCWDGQDNGSPTTWSGDMGKGLFTYAWRCKRLDMAEEHAAYGEANNWVMGEGEPGAVLSRAVYRPTMVGLLYRVIHALGGEDNPKRLVPQVFSGGLTDFEAHLQMLTIALMGEMGEATGEADAVPAPPPEGAEYVFLAPNENNGLQLAKAPENGPKSRVFDANTPPFEGLLLADGGLRLLDINETMFKRIEEHYQRDSADPLFSALHAIYSGDYTPALMLCARPYTPGMYLGEYVRCADQKGCELGHFIHACDMVLRRYPSG